MQSAVLYVHQLKLAFFVTRNHNNELFSVIGILSYAKLCVLIAACWALRLGLDLSRPHLQIGNIVISCHCQCFQIRFFFAKRFEIPRRLLLTNVSY